MHISPLPLSDPEERGGAAGICHHVQRGAAETVLPAVHRPQHWRPAGVEVRN